MRNLRRITSYYRKRVISRWPAIAQNSSRKEALAIAEYFARQKDRGGPNDWDIESRLARRWHVIVPPECEETARTLLRVAGFTGIF